MVIERKVPRAGALAMLIRWRPPFSCTSVLTVLILTMLVLPASDSVFAQNGKPTRISVAGVELHYIEHGRGEPLILLHGGQGDYRAWQPQIDALSGEYRVISYSRRYHYPNRNPLQSTNHSALVDADDLAGLIATLRLGSAHLVGTSYGAFTALALAVNQPELVTSMVLAEPPVHSWIATTARGRTLYEERVKTVHEPAGEAFAVGQDEAAMRLFIDAFDGRGTFDRLPAERRRAIMQNAVFFRALTASSDPFPNLSKDAVRRLKMPVLILKGANTDELHGLVTEELGRLLPNARRVIIPDAGHGSPRQNPPAFNAVVREFLKEQGANRQ